MSKIIKKFESHVFAPELNKVHYFRSGVRIATFWDKPSLLESRSKDRDTYKKHFKNQKHVRKFIKVQFYYDNPEYEWCNQERSGTFETYSSVLDYIKDYLKRNSGGKLLDGSEMPAVKYRVLTIKTIVC